VAPTQAQTLIPSSITGPITNSKLVNDLEDLFALKLGKLVNWNQQYLNALESDLKIDSPKNLAPKHLANTSKPELAAQLIDGTGSGRTPQLAPVPEPGTLVVFGLVTTALAVRQMQPRRK
jgi:PEP-CTERM motif